MWCQSCLWDYYYKEWERWARDTKGTHVPHSAELQLLHLWCPQTEVRILQKGTVKLRVGGQGQTEWTRKAFPGLPDGPWRSQQWDPRVSHAMPIYSSCRPVSFTILTFSLSFQSHLLVFHPFLTLPLKYYSSIMPGFDFSFVIFFFSSVC